MANGTVLHGAVKTANGLEINGIVLEPVVENCQGCDRTKVIEGQTYCSSYAKPSAKWRHGGCNFATHVKATLDKEGHVKINPLKASKRAAKKR